MKIVQVTYKTKAGYVTKNQQNIQQVMADLQKLNHSGLRYYACLRPDGQSFIHTAFFKTDDDEKHLLTLPSFIAFQQELKAEGLESPPKQEQLEMVGASWAVF